MDLFVPPRVAREIHGEARRRETEAMKALVADRGWAWVQEFNVELDRIEHGLRLVFCPDPAPVDAVACGAKPGRWHVFRPATSGPMSVLPITGPNGEFAEPSSAVFDMLRRNDWWDDRVISDRRKREERLQRAEKDREEKERADFNRDIYERWLAVSRTQVSMNRDTAWGQNAAGAKRARGNKGK